MSKILSIAAAHVFFYAAAVALLGAAGSEAAVVEHTFVVSSNALCSGFFSKTFKGILNSSFFTAIWNNS
jgi:hypothetical protein